MKKFSRYVKIISLAILLSLALAAFPAPCAEEYSVPTLYINNAAWHMYSLFPLTEQNGTYLVPSSFFGAVDGVEINLDEKYQCLLLQYEDRYISINIPSSNALLHTGEVRKTAIWQITDEYFIDAELCAEALGFTVETAVFYEKTVLRIKTHEDLLDFKALVERNQVSQSALPERTDDVDDTPKRREKNLAFIADFTRLSQAEQEAFTSFLAEKKLSATVILQKKNLTDGELLKNIIKANALGCSFIISAKSTGDVSECNRILGTVLRNRTRLVSAANGLKAPLEAIGYIFMGEADAKASTNPAGFDLTTLTTVEITNFTNQTKANTEKWIAAAEQGSVYIRALCGRTGN